MRQKISESVEIPAEVECSFENRILKCKKGGVEILKDINLPSMIVKIDGGKISFTSEKGNKNDRKIIGSYLAHVKNIFHGMDEKYGFKMQACNVHFPMTLKIEGSKLSISNFLGEKTKRYAKITNGVDVVIKGQDVLVSSHNIEKAGITAANIEKATRIVKKDRRVFQDGIFIVERGWGVAK